MKRYNIKKDFLIREYIKKRKSSYKIAEDLNYSQTTILDYLKLYNIRRRTKRELLLGKPSRNLKYKIAKNILIKKYIREKRNIHQISKIFKCCDGVIRNYLIKYNIPIRNRGYQDGRSSRKYRCKKCGKEICIKTYKYGLKRCGSCSQKLNSKGKKNPMYGKVTHGKWGKYKTQWMRSSYEIAYAKYLDKNNIKWQYEPKAFDLGNTTYTPDFYLPEKDLYIEIKGWWREDARKKYRKFKKKFKNINIEILDRNKLKEMNLLIE